MSKRLNLLLITSDQHRADCFGFAGRNAQYLSRKSPEATAAQTFHSGLPVAFHNSTWIGDRAVELYDLANDPHELKNLFNRPEHADIQAVLTEMINARPKDMQPVQDAPAFRKR